MAESAVARLRRLARGLARTPIHPQWLLTRVTPPVEWLNVHDGDTVLDVGCGTRWLEAALPRGVRYVGVDHPNPGERYGTRPDAYADAARLPVADGSVTAVAMFEVLEHVREPTAAVREAARVLAPGGRLVVTMPFLYPVHDAPYDFQRDEARFVVGTSPA